MRIVNPFLITGYYGEELFCDREKEIKILSKNLQGGVNTTLISIRRMGKTALIQRVFEEISKTELCICLFVDLYPTRNIKDLSRQLATVVMQKFPAQKSGGKKFLNFIKGFRPVITYDPLNGNPELRFEYSAVSDYEMTISALFSYLEQQKMPVYIAFDEFQQIAAYDEENAEALLRTIIQPLKNIHFIFSGSNKHMMTEIFNSSVRPFFATTRLTGLFPIPEEKYSQFISGKFLLYKKTISNEAVSFILHWTRSHTYYTQVVCNAVFLSGIKNAGVSEVKVICAGLLEEQEKIFLQYRSLLSSNQWQVLRAIAKEGKVYKPYSGEYITKYSLGSPATSQRALESLMSKELIYQEEDNYGSYYSVYDVFFSRWLEKW